MLLAEYGIAGHFVTRPHGLIKSGLIIKEVNVPLIPEGDKHDRVEDQRHTEDADTPDDHGYRYLRGCVTAVPTKAFNGCVVYFRRVDGRWCRYTGTVTVLLKYVTKNRNVVVLKINNVGRTCC